MILIAEQGNLYIMQNCMLMKISHLFFTVLTVGMFTPHAFSQKSNKPNIVVVIADQWRAQTTGYGGNKDVRTPNLNALAQTSVNIKNAVAGMPVCTPFRGSLLTGQYPLTTGLFMNDVMLDTNKVTIADLYRNAGYNTGFIGKWHIDGHGRSSFIPENRRHGFEYWKVLECTHNYNRSAYYSGDSEKKLFWDGYDALAQSEDAAKFIADHAKSENPFMLFVSLGPPHDPYPSAPEQFKVLYRDKTIPLAPNIPVEMQKKIQVDIKNYYAHISALDHGIGKIMASIKNAGIDNNTIFIFTSDHGDLMGAHGQRNKQQPYEESIRVPFLLHYPDAFGNTKRESPILLNSPDIMPTILGLSNMKIPGSVEGINYSEVLKGTRKNKRKETLISCVQPFGQWSRANGGREYRGLVTVQYTFVRDLKGPWLLFDNNNDPYQLNNLVGKKASLKIQRCLDKTLLRRLKATHDEFLPGMQYVKRWNYTVDQSETVPYVNLNYEGKPIKE